MSSDNIGKRNVEDVSPDPNYPSLNSHLEKILIVVKTYPSPSISYRETVCTAGITEKSVWIRLYPIKFRYIGYSRQYKKYQWITVEIEKNWKDPRVDSYRPHEETIHPIGKPLPAGHWDERKRLILPTIKYSSLHELQDAYKNHKISLGIFKPKEIQDFIIEADKPDWSKKHQQVLGQTVLFGRQTKVLQKIPYKFSYKFLCNYHECKGHKLGIFDWEIFELYRSLKIKYPYDIDVVLEKIKQKWLHEMWREDKDSYLIVGTEFPYPTFMALGVFWPPK